MQAEAALNARCTQSGPTGLQSRPKGMQFSSRILCLHPRTSRPVDPIPPRICSGACYRQLPFCSVGKSAFQNVIGFSIFISHLKDVGHYTWNWHYLKWNRHIADILPVSTSAFVFSIGKFSPKFELKNTSSSSLEKDFSWKKLPIFGRFRIHIPVFHCFMILVKTRQLKNTLSGSLLIWFLPVQGGNTGYGMEQALVEPLSAGLTLPITKCFYLEWGLP